MGGWVGGWEVDMWVGDWEAAAVAAAEASVATAVAAATVGGRERRKLHTPAGATHPVDVWEGPQRPQRRNRPHRVTYASLMDCSVWNPIHTAPDPNHVCVAARPTYSQPSRPFICLRTMNLLYP